MSVIIQGSSTIIASGSTIINNRPPVKIGNQHWMPVNLNVTKFRNGELIPEIQDPTEWANATGPAWCSYNNDPANDAIYGKLYNWSAIYGGLAPEGWHVPDVTEFDELFAVTTTNSASAYLRETGTAHWLAPNTDALDLYGFKLLPGGYRDEYGNFTGSVSSAHLWSLSHIDRRAFDFQANTSNVASVVPAQNLGASVRVLANVMTASACGTYTWTAPLVNTILTASGHYSASSNGGTVYLDLTVHPIPGIGGITGSHYVCRGSDIVYTYTITGSSGADSYKWILPKGVDQVNGATGSDYNTTIVSTAIPSIDVTASVDMYTYTPIYGAAVNAYGCSSEYIQFYLQPSGSGC